MSFAFTEKNREKIQELKLRYPSPNALTLPLLWMAQQQEGYISIDAIDVIAKETLYSPMDIYKTATFYTMFNLEPKAKYHIQLCKTLSCSLCGSKEVLEHIKKKTDEDERFTLSQVECLGSCSSAPVMQINDKNYENLTPEKIDEILQELT
jgi:NADH-quinone oxidoreductase subunit E